MAIPHEVEGIPQFQKHMGITSKFKELNENDTPVAPR
jgi:hypothetical protein